MHVGSLLEDESAEKQAEFLPEACPQGACEGLQLNRPAEVAASSEAGENFGLKKQALAKLRHTDIMQSRT